MNMNLQPSVNVTNMYDMVNGEMSKFNPTILIIFTLVIIFYFAVFNTLGSSMTSSNGLFSQTSGQTSSSGLSILELLFWVMLVFLVLINGLQYFFKIDVKTAIKNIFSPIPEIDVTITKELEQEEPIPEILFEKQVFNIPENNYTYTDAKAVCKAYGARLAKYDEVEQAYNDGAEWCNYGWSEDQMILYPTQKSTYDGLQKKPGYEHSCGRPGINGGYIANPNAKFGINCYGFKPEITQDELLAMENTQPTPISKKDREFEEKVNEYRKNLKNIMISPFNKKRWSII